MPTARPVALGGATLVTIALATTVWLLVEIGAHSLMIRAAAPEVLTFLPALVVVTLAAVPWAIVAEEHHAVRVSGLTLAGVCSVLPMWAAAPAADARGGALLLATAPLALTGLAVIAHSWSGATVATGVTGLQALTYDPFADVGCVWQCLQVPATWPMDTFAVVLLSAIGVVATCVLVLARSGRGEPGLDPFLDAAAVGFAGLAVARLVSPDDPAVHAVTLLGPGLLVGVVAAACVARWIRARLARTAARRVAAQLAADPEALVELADRVDVTLLSAGQRLAISNARLAQESRRRLEDVRASQRRIVATRDAERRRIERDLHDGIQQRLVGVLMLIAGRGLDDVELQVKGVLADLREFSRGRFPEVLDEEGLVAALHDLAERSDADIRLSTALDHDPPKEHARAVLALVDAAACGTVDVRVTAGEDGVVVVVDGAVPDDLGDAWDRFGALGGDLVRTRSGIEGSLPCGW